MRIGRNTGEPTVLLGYHAGDVEEMKRSLTEARQEMEKELTEEREVYLTEFSNKIQEIDELRSLLEKAQAEERRLIEEGVTLL